MKKKLPFKLPESFLNQLKEFTNGYHLVVVDENMSIESYSNFPSEIVALGVINHLDIEAEQLQSDLRMNLSFESEEDDDLDGSED